MRPPPRRSAGPGPLSGLLLLGVALVPPLLGAWVASSLAVHHGALPSWSAAAGLGLGLGLPLVWEALSAYRARRARPKRWLRPGTRLLLRAWAVNLVFLGGALLLSPRGVFTALSPEYGGARYACTVLGRGPSRIQVFAGTQTPPPLAAQLEVTGF